MKGLIGTVRSMGEVRVRRAMAVDADRRALASMRRAWAEEDAGGPIDDPGFEGRAVAWVAANESHRLCWLAEDGVATVGLVTVVVVDRMPQPGRPDSGWGYVHHFFVVPERRSKGIGRLLIDAAIAEADARGWQQLLLNPRPPVPPLLRASRLRSGGAPPDPPVRPPHRLTPRARGCQPIGDRGRDDAVRSAGGRSPDPQGQGAATATWRASPGGVTAAVGAIST